MNPHKLVSKPALAAFCQKRGIRRLAVFGSALRDDFGPESDIDLLVEFEPDRIPGLLGVAVMELELSQLFAGRKVDLRTAEDLSPYFRKDVLYRADRNRCGPHPRENGAGSCLMRLPLRANWSAGRPTDPDRQVGAVRSDRIRST